MRFGFIQKWRHVWQIETMCRVMEVTTRGYRAWVKRPMSDRARGDMRVLAHIKDQYAQSLGSYGRPRRLNPIIAVILAKL
jgi:putative transposase